MKGGEGGGHTVGLIIGAKSVTSHFGTFTSITKDPSKKDTYAIETIEKLHNTIYFSLICPLLYLLNLLCSFLPQGKFPSQVCNIEMNKVIYYPNNGMSIAFKNQILKNDVEKCKQNNIK